MKDPQLKDMCTVLRFNVEITQCNYLVLNLIHQLYIIKMFIEVETEQPLRIPANYLNMSLTDAICTAAT